MAFALLTLAAIALFSACGGTAGGNSQGGPSELEKRPAVRLLFAGDVMLGRGVARIAAFDPDELLAGIRFEISSADLAMANLESPLTLREHLAASGPDALEAPPSSARLLASTGFDAVAIANNHAGDAGPETVNDTLSALEEARIEVVGAGRTIDQAFEPRIVEAGDLSVALLALDLTGEGPKAGSDQPGVAWWDEARAREVVEKAHSSAGVVVVALHGGLPYAPESDPYLMRLSRRIASWGADVVWAAGAHVVQPVRLIENPREERPAIVATSLGNLVFDQHIPRTRSGALLEVLVGADGVRAYRVGDTFAGAPARFRDWRPPASDAVALEGGWWTLARRLAAAPSESLPDLSRFEGDVTAASLGDLVGNDAPQLAVSFRRPYRATEVNTLVPRSELLDHGGRTAHIGLYRPRDLRPLWVAGTLLRPVAGLAACDGALGLSYSTLDDRKVVATGAWKWDGFGFAQLPDLPGYGRPACADADGDGSLDPLILERSSR